MRSSDVSIAAVSQVIALHLWDTSERPETETDLPRQLRHKVRRALQGEELTGETLTWFITAFEMSDRDDQQLWANFAGDAIGAADGIINTVPIARPMGKRQWHRTMTLFERYFFASDRSYVQRRTMQVVQAIEDGVDSYLFNHEPFASRIEVLYGGGLGQHYEYGNGLVSDDILFGRALQTGQRNAIEYETFFDSGVHQPTEVRRAVRARVENLDFAIQFAANHAPQHVWFCAWTDHYLGDPIIEEPLSLDDSAAAHRFVAYAQNTVLGFRWKW
jgi:hypothetical protein